MPTPANALAVMAKAPLPGMVKTRLVPPLTEGQAAELYGALLLDQLDHLSSLDDAARYLAFAPGEAAALIESMLPPGYVSFAQGEGDLGARMRQVFEELWRRGHRHVVLIGGDLPPVPLENLRQAFGQLAGADKKAVLGPSRDGGYYLIGLNRPMPEIFSAMSWSHDQVLAQTAARLAALGVEFRLLEPWFDIDKVEDVKHLGSIGNPTVRAAMRRTLRCVSSLGF